MISLDLASDVWFGGESDWPPFFRPCLERGGSCCDAGVFLSPNFDTLARASAKQLSGCRASEFEVLLSPIRRHRSPRFDANVLKSSALYHIFRVLPVLGGPYCLPPLAIGGAANVAPAPRKRATAAVACHRNSCPVQ